MKKTVLALALWAFAEVSGGQDLPPVSAVKILSGDEATSIGNTGDRLKTDATISSIPLPPNASTETKQDAGNASLTAIDATTTAINGKVATEAKQDTGITSLQILDDVPTTPNGAVSKGNPLMGQLDDASTVDATENNASVLRLTPKRAGHVNLRNQAGTEVGVSAAPLHVEIKDLVGSTSQYSGTVGTTPISIPTVAGNALSEVLIRCPVQTPNTVYISVSFDGGANFLRLSVGEFMGWSLKGGITQIQIKGNTAGVAYEVIANREDF